jgi:mRNA-degrading endonuclease RelE of RelBE toxin-antitoxin system
MAKPQRYNLIYAPEVKEHLKAINKQHHAQIREAIEERLGFEPDREPRNRKPLEESALWEDAWELRCGGQNHFRIFYQIDHTAMEVRILAIGVTDRNELIIGKEKVKL